MIIYNISWNSVIELCRKLSKSIRENFKHRRNKHFFNIIFKNKDVLKYNRNLEKQIVKHLKLLNPKKKYIRKNS